MSRVWGKKREAKFLHDFSEFVVGNVVKLIFGIKCGLGIQFCIGKGDGCLGGCDSILIVVTFPLFCLVVFVFYVSVFVYLSAIVPCFVFYVSHN